MSSNQFSFRKGEIKEISGYVEPKKAAETVVILSAIYECKRSADKFLVDSGECEVNGDEFSLIYHATDTGCFDIDITIHVGKEKMIKTAVVNVSD